METLIFATGNAHKVREIKKYLGESYNIKSLQDIGCIEDIPETSPTIEGNALQKARYVVQHYQVDCFSEDTGLEIEALNGEPGVFSARYAGPERSAAANMTKVLKKLEGRSNRKARFKTVIALIQGGKEYTFEGIVEGHIAFSPKGSEGFGYDPIFIPEQENRTFAEMGLTEKNKISHRARAVDKLVQHLNLNT